MQYLTGHSHFHSNTLTSSNEIYTTNQYPTVKLDTNDLFKINRGGTISLSYGPQVPHSPHNPSQPPFRKCENEFLANLQPAQHLRLSPTQFLLNTVPQ